MNRKIYVSFFLIALLLTACCSRRISAPAPVNFVTPPLYSPIAVASQAPVPTAYRLSTQRTMQAVYHWELLAEDIACRIQSALEQRYLENQKPVYVVPSGTTPFEKAFHALLITRLVEKGLLVSDHSQDNLLLSFDINMITHMRKIIKTNRGMYKSLAPGFFVKNDAPLFRYGGQTAIVERLVKNSEVNVEAGLYSFELPKHEIIITASLTYNAEYLARTSATYYIKNPEWWHYKHNPSIHGPTVVTYSLVSGQGESNE